MRDSVSLRGYTSVMLVLDMRQFIAAADQQRFERIRGTRALADVLRQSWHDQLRSGATFVPQGIAGGRDDGGSEQRASREEIGFISGIFRANMLEEYATPTYRLRKERVAFPDAVAQNLQFKELFADVWRRWEIFVRPTVTGMLVVRLTRRYDKATPIMTVASDVVRLQMVFDIPGALERLRELDTSPEPADVRAAKALSIRELLRWLGDGTAEHGQPDYVPVQWKLALEVCRRLVEEVGLAIPVAGGAIQLAIPDRTTAMALHDSYVLYHVDELSALELVVAKARHEAAVAALGDRSGDGDVAVQVAPDDRHQVLVTAEDIRHSAEIQRNLIQLIEGSILEKVRPKTNGARPQGADGASRRARRSARYFPIHRPDFVAAILAEDRATWNDELCLLAPRTAIIMPSRRAGQDALFVSNFSATTGQVMYAWYWEALERMVEFVVEIRVLAQTVERGSADVLQEFGQALSEMRSGLLRRDRRMDYGAMTPLIDQVANLSRMVGLCQGLSNPGVWSRAEYAVEKARHLLEQQGVPLLLDHTERNVGNLTSLLDHADELYLAELSERTSQETFWLSLVLAGLSLSITLFALPSFWTDLSSLDAAAGQGAVPRAIIPWIGVAGDLLAPLLILGSLAIAVTAIYRFLSFRARRRVVRRGRRQAGR